MSHLKNDRTAEQSARMAQAWEAHNAADMRRDRLETVLFWAVMALSIAAVAAVILLILNIIAGAAAAAADPFAGKPW